MHQHAHIEKQTNGRWNRHEHQRFLEGLRLYGKDWKKIQILVGTRNGAQIRSHAQKFFIKMKKQTEDPLDNSENSKESPLDHPADSVQEQSQTISGQHSYFMGKIMNSGVLTQNSLQFWRQLVDFKHVENYGCEAVRRKSSFVSLGGGDTGELDPYESARILSTEY